MASKAKTSGEVKLDGFFEALSADLDVLATRRDIGEKRLFSVSRLHSRMRKRAQYIKPELVPKCISEFLEINKGLLDVKISLDKEIVENAREFIENALARYTYSADPDDYGCLSMKHLMDLWKFGPGASHGVEYTHTALKIRQKMSCTNLSEPIVSNLRSCNPYFNAFDCANDGGTAVVIGSRLTTAPKNEDTVRIIAIEPSGSMALQLAAGRYLEGALRYIGLDIKDQEPKNKALALLGSVTGGIATLDLSKASDRILILLIRMLFPSIWYDLLVRLRSPKTIVTDDTLPDGVFDLNMMSTMGNGFTFPMMTLMLVALVYANRAVHHKLKRRLYVDWTLTAVYGDDIIVPTHEAATLIDVLHQAGLVVNTNKSYTDGPFRESCGGDYYKGWDVLPFYVESLNTPSEVYVALNKLTEWCCRNELILFRSIKQLLSLLPGPPLLVPEWHNPNEGWLCTQVSAKYKYISTVPKALALCDSIFDMSLAIGGYIQQRIEPTKGYRNKLKPHVWGDFKPVEVGATRVVCFEVTCRESPVVTRLRTARLPRGYLDGHDAVRRSVRTSAWAQLIVNLAA